jgi:uncharacterized protein
MAPGEDTPMTPREQDYEAPQPRFWNGGSAARTIAFDAFSLMFPAAEAFMIRAAKAAHDKLDDRDLRRAIAGFVRQESAHARLHGAYNRAMEARGFDALNQEERNGAFIAMMDGRIGLRRKLAASAGLEHFTALIAERIIADEHKLLAGAAPAYRALWLWHAEEEIEHKAVAFDVHAALYPNSAWISRARAMIVSVLMLIALYWGNVWRLAGDVEEQPRWKTLLGVTWFLLGTPGLFRRIALPTLAYFLPGFHPEGSRSGGERAHLGGGENGLGESPGAGGLEIRHRAA